MKEGLKKPGLYLKLFTSTFYLSAFTFGGGYVIVPLLKKKFADELKWIEEKEMLDLVAIAQSSPGAIAINTSILIGYRTAGFAGSLLAVLGTALPPLIILTVISFFYSTFSENIVISALLKGMQAGVAAVIADVVLNMGRGIIKDKKLIPAMLMLGSFIAAFFFSVNAIYIILFCGLLGLAQNFFGKAHRTGKDNSKNDLS